MPPEPAAADFGSDWMTRRTSVEETADSANRRLSCSEPAESGCACIMVTGLVVLIRSLTVSIYLLLIRLAEALEAVALWHGQGRRVDYFTQASASLDVLPKESTARPCASDKEISFARRKAFVTALRKTLYMLCDCSVLDFKNCLY